MSLQKRRARGCGCRAPRLICVGRSRSSLLCDWYTICTTPSSTDYIKHNAAILQNRSATNCCYLPATILGMLFISLFFLLSFARFHSWILRPVEFARTQVEALDSVLVHGTLGGALK